MNEVPSFLTVPAEVPFTPEQLNDMRRAVLRGEQVDVEALKKARNQMRQRNTVATSGVKKAKEAEALTEAVAGGGDALDF